MKGRKLVEWIKTLANVKFSFFVALKRNFLQSGNGDKRTWQDCFAYDPGYKFVSFDIIFQFSTFILCL